MAERDTTLATTVRLSPALARAAREGAALDCDVLVIGGGVNGTGVARDCALRGLRVRLYEKHDFAFGASGNSSGMVHGGVRYLTTHPEVTAQSCLDSGFIQSIAPHLVFRIPFVFPIRKRRGDRIVEAALDAFFAAYDRYQPLKRGKRHNRLSADEALALEPTLAPAMRGAITFDEWGIDGARLCVLNALDAERHGGHVHNHHEVVGLLRDEAALAAGTPSAVRGVIVRDRLTGRRESVTARLVVNATGAWGPVTAKLGGASLRLRPGKGIHVFYERRLSNYGVVVTAVDGRQIFVMPWGNMSMIGTTDDDYFGDLDDVRPTSDEVRYLVESVEHYVPSAKGARIIGTTTGVRPTIYAYGKTEDSLSREHEIIDHTKDGLPGLFSMIGGKLASYRLFAEEMSDVVAATLGHDARSKTHLQPLPGGERVPESAPLATQHELPEPLVRRLVERHGTLTEDVLDAARVRPELRAVTCRCECVLEAEVRWACRHEHVRTVSDLSRRTRLGLGSCGGQQCALRAAQVVAEENGYPASEAPTLAASFLVERYRFRAPTLDGAQARSEELLAARMAWSGLLGRAR
ncbi:MAG: glycerol-3-phosphate dehydrogenase/oxidase [Deltaproteobacteria bacterium]|nr:glycerol-3-phosphate dehydrogenase/oxidase [Deltaproteobacteria bacterium]